MHPVTTLIFNHADAWGVSLVIGTAAAILHNVPFSSAIVVCPLIAYSYWLGFAVNDYFDAAPDALDPLKRDHNFFSRTQVAPEAARAGFVLALLPLIVLTSASSVSWLLGGAGIAAMLAYSMPPIRLKSRPPFDLLSHACFVQTFPYLAVLVLLNVTPSPTDFALLAVFFLSSLGAQLEQQVRDHDTDAHHGDHTFVVIVGRSRGALLLKLVSALTIVVALGVFAGGLLPGFLLPFGMIVFPVFAHRFVRPVEQGRPPWLTRIAMAFALGYTLLLLAGLSLR